jgi:ribonucleoside-diphosphate reductase alpha chain
MYYLRSKAATDAIKFTLDKDAMAKPEAKDSSQPEPSMAPKQSDMQCSLDNPDECIACGS